MALRRTLTQVPTTELTVINVQSPSVTWIGTRQGAVRLTRDNQAREYFAGLRWLPDDHVTGIGVRRGTSPGSKRRTASRASRTCR